MLDEDYIIRKYADGFSADDIGGELGVCFSTILKILKTNGIPRRSTAESLRLRGTRERARLLPEVKRRFDAGESVKAIAEALDMTRGSLALHLNDLGIRKRNRSEAMYLRMAQTSPEERSRLSEKAHQAVRELSKEFFHEAAKKQALSKHKTRSKVGFGEPEFLQWVRDRRISGSPQVAESVYNIDILLPTLAVEIHNNACHPHTHTYFRKRIESAQRWV
jgi:hypothetical protein